MLEAMISRKLHGVVYSLWSFHHSDMKVWALSQFFMGDRHSPLAQSIQTASEYLI